MRVCSRKNGFCFCLIRFGVSATAGRVGCGISIHIRCIGLGSCPSTFRFSFAVYDEVKAKELAWEAAVKDAEELYWVSSNAIRLQFKKAVQNAVTANKVVGAFAIPTTVAGGKTPQQVTATTKPVQASTPTAPVKATATATNKLKAAVKAK